MLTASALVDLINARVPGLAIFDGATPAIVRIRKTAFVSGGKMLILVMPQRVGYNLSPISPVPVGQTVGALFPRNVLGYIDRTAPATCAMCAVCRSMIEVSQAYDYASAIGVEIDALILDPTEGYQNGIPAFPSLYGVNPLFENLNAQFTPVPYRPFFGNRYLWTQADETGFYNGVTLLDSTLDPNFSPYVQPTPEFDSAIEMAGSGERTGLAAVLPFMSKSRVAVPRIPDNGLSIFAGIGKDGVLAQSDDVQYLHYFAYFLHDRASIPQYQVILTGTPFTEGTLDPDAPIAFQNQP
jgi:hypothetical protein